MIRTCTKCGFTGDDSLFAKGRNVCISCYKEQKKQYRKENKKRIADHQKIYYHENKEIILPKRRQYYHDNKERISIRAHIYYLNNRQEILDKAKANYKINREHKIIYAKEYSENNKEKNSINRRKYEKNKKQTNPKFKLKCIISTAIYNALRKRGSSKQGLSFLKYMDYTIEDLFISIQSKFEYWMTWENHGVYDPKTWDDNDPSTWRWQFDHEKPESDFNYTSPNDPEFKECWSLKNLRPLSAKQNILDGVNRTRHIKIK